MFQRWWIRMTVTALTAGLVVGCTTNPYTGEQKVSNTGKGAAIGAGAGAIIGAVSGHDNRGERAAIGAGIGALAGGAVGAYMDAQESKLRAQLAGTGVSVTRVGNDIVLNMPGNITFATNSADIRGDFYDVLNSVALVLKEYQKTVIEIYGHTDSTGEAAYNMDLSERRAASVGRYLESQGIQFQRIVTKGFGEEYPVATNDTPEGRQLNRRVELRLVPITAS